MNSNKGIKEVIEWILCTAAVVSVVFAVLALLRLVEMVSVYF